MRALARFPLAPLIALAIAACAPAEPESPPARRTAPARETRAAPVATDRERYSMQEGPYGPEVVIVSTFTAPAGRPVFLANCNGAISTSLEERIDGRWVDVWGAEINACLSEPIVIAAGQTLSERIVAASGAHALVDARVNSTRIDGGTYRVVWNGLYASFDARARPWGIELSVEQRASGPFTIDPPPPHDPARSSPARPPAELARVEPPHGSSAGASDAIRLRLDLRGAGVTLRGMPLLFVDRRWIERPRIAASGAPPGSVEIEYLPSPGWTREGHEARVVYMVEPGTTRWFAWSFMVP